MLGFLSLPVFKCDTPPPLMFSEIEVRIITEDTVANVKKGALMLFVF